MKHFIINALRGSVFGKFFELNGIVKDQISRE